MKALYLLALFPFAAFANPINDNCPQHTIHGAPVSSITENTQYVCHSNYAIHYRYDTKTAEYVVEHLDDLDINGPAKRKDDFRPDDLIPDDKEATLEDYSGEPYDRGHLAPAANNRASQEQMSESFFLSNMVPQVANNNRGIWKQLEMQERQWATAPGTDFYIISGGIYDAGHAKTGNGLGIPTRLYKIIIEKNSKRVMAYLMPNQALPVADLPKYQTTVQAVEQATGFKFNFPK
jgi:endonuclease G